MKNEKIKNIIIAMLFLIIVGLIGLIIYFLNIKNTTKENTNCTSVDTVESIETDSNVDSTNSGDIPISDKYAFTVNSYSDSLNATIYLIENGQLYYKVVENYDNDIYGTYMTNTDNNMVKLSGLNNIIRIKGINTVSTGTDFNVLLLTADGKVYEYKAGWEKARQNSFLEAYNIKDVTVYNAYAGCVKLVENMKTCGGTFKFITQDDVEHSIVLNQDGTITEE